MILCDGETYFGSSLKSAIFIHEYYIWRFEWILEGEQDLSVVDALMKLCVLWSLDGKVPVVEVIG